MAQAVSAEVRGVEQGRTLPKVPVGGAELLARPPKQAVPKSIGRLSAEARLIAAVTAPSRLREEIDEALRRCRDWSAVLRFAHVNGVRHQLAVVLVTEEHLGHVPPASAQLLKRLTRQAFVLDQMAVTVLGEVIEGFDRAQVPFILLKGLGLAERLYRQPFERVSADVDILTPAGFHDRAEELLLSIGYKPHLKAFYENHHFHVPYRRPSSSGSPVVELHWQVTKRDAHVHFDVSRWWSEARSMELRSGSVLVPPAAEEFLYLCHHALVRGCTTVRSLTDISRLHAQLHGMDHGWDFVASARRSGATGFWYQALELSRQLWHSGTTEIPQLEPRSRRRRWLIRNLMQGRTVLKVGDSAWWPFRRTCYWALLDPERARPRDLVRRVLGGRRSSSNSNSHGYVQATVKLCALALALAFCLLPGRLFPARFRGD